MTFLSDLDQLLTALGFRKIAEFADNDFDKSKSEKCDSSSGVGGCSSSVNGEIIVYNGGIPSTGAIAIYLYFEYQNAYYPSTGSESGDCYTLVEVTVETDVTTKTIFKDEDNLCRVSV